MTTSIVMASCGETCALNFGNCMLQMNVCISPMTRRGKGGDKSSTGVRDKERRPSPPNLLLSCACCRCASHTSTAMQEEKQCLTSSSKILRASAQRLGEQLGLSALACNNYHTL